MGDAARQRLNPPHRSGCSVSSTGVEDEDHDRLLRVEERLISLAAVVASISPADHDRIIALEAGLHSLEMLARQRSDLLVARIEQTTDSLGKQLDSLRMQYERAHDELVGRVSALSSQQAALTGTSTGTVRIFLVAAVMISLAGVLFTVVHLLTG